MPHLRRAPNPYPPPARPVPRPILTCTPASTAAIATPTAQHSWIAPRRISTHRSTGFSIPPPRPADRTHSSAAQRRAAASRRARSATPAARIASYSDAVCGCLPCLDLKNGGVRGTMHCRLRTDVQAGCPTPRPRLGDACSTEGLICDYTQCCGGPSLGPSMQCSGGYWHSYSSGACACPMRICP